jgi:hypothetical protein
MSRLDTRRPLPFNFDMASNPSVPKSPILGAGPLEQRPISRNSKQLAPAQEIVFWEDHNPKCVINLVSNRLRELMRELPPELLTTPVNKLRRQLNPGWVVEQIRIAFWDEYFLTIDNEETSMRMAAVYGKVCAKEHFYDYIKHPLTLAYILQPPSDYMYKMRAMLDMGLERFDEILHLPLENPNGTVNTKLISEIVKVVALIDNRVKGAVAQKLTIDQTSKNLNVNVNQTYEAPKSAREIQQELHDIEQEIKQLSSSPSPEILFEAPSALEEEDDTIEVTASRPG